VFAVPIAGGPLGTLGTVAPEQPEGNIAIDATHLYWTTLGPPGEVVSFPLVGGTPTSLASTPGVGGWNVAVDATSIYWTTPNGLLKAPLTGGTTTTVASTGGAGVAVEANYAYVAAPDDYAVLRVPIAGGTVATLASGVYPLNVAVDATSVYWPDGMSLTDGTIMKVAIGGGTPTTLISGLKGPTAIAIDATNVYWSAGDGTIGYTAK
jgi:hypothetical protein